MFLRKHSRKILNPAIAAGLLAAPLVSAAPAPEFDPASTSNVVQSEARQVGDPQITEVVLREIGLDPLLANYDIQVETQKGIVTLAGQVNSLLANDRAVRLAQSIRGVQSVIDQIQINPVKKSDLQLEEDIRWTLAMNPATEYYEVDVDADQGLVRLEGRVDSWAERRLAERMARSIAGVKAVENQLLVTTATNRPDPEILLEVEQALAWNQLVDDGLIEVRVDRGVVHLSGHVGSALEKEEAILTANVGGVTKVQADDLITSPFLPRDQLREAKYVDRPDDTIEKTIRRTIAQDARVQVKDVLIEVDDGKALLRGSVNSIAAARAAAEDAHNTVGVRSVVNQLQVKASKPVGDKQLKASIQKALQLDSVVDAETIRVQVNQGQVTLQGHVENYYAMAQAEMAVSRLAGVAAVDNQLKVENAVGLSNDVRLNDWRTSDFAWYQPDAAPEIELTDSQIRENVLNQLWWNPLVDISDVDIQVEDGLVTLTGSVDSWLESMRAEEEALEGGADLVMNKLSLELDS